MRDIALIGKKIGMTREFYKTGQSVPVTVLKMEFFGGAPIIHWSTTTAACTGYASCTAVRDMS